MTLPNGDEIMIALSNSGAVKITLPKGYTMSRYDLHAYGAEAAKPVIRPVPPAA